MLTSHIRNRNSLNVEITTILIGVLCFVMILPDDVFALIPLYKSETPSNIAYRWLNYNFGIIQLIVLCIGVYYAIRLEKKWLVIFIVFATIREIIYLILSDNNIFYASAYEMYLTVFVGYAFFLWVEGGLHSFEEREKFFKWFLITNMLTLYINFVMGNRGNIIVGRYHSSNLDAGGTGTVCVLCVLFLAYSTKRKWFDYIYIILSVIGLLLSGSRANLLFLIIILALYRVLKLFLRFRSEEKDSELKNAFFRRFIISGVALLTITVVFTIYFDDIFNWLLGSRFQALLSSQGIRSDDSFLGRSASLTTGLDVLKEHPIGISGYFINLQQEIRMRGYPTFPHSTLLSMYLLFGPIVLILYGKWIKLTRKLRMIDVKYYLIILYMLISTIIYGGPIVNFKTVFIIAMITSLSHQAVETFEYQSNDE